MQSGASPWRAAVREIPILRPSVLVQKKRFNRLQGKNLAKPRRSSPHYRKYNRHIFDVLRVIFCH